MSAIKLFVSALLVLTSIPTSTFSNASRNNRVMRPNSMIPQQALIAVLNEFPRITTNSFHFLLCHPSLFTFTQIKKTH